MKHIHHKPIKRFSLEGTIHDDSAIGRLKEEYVRLLVNELRIAGYALRLDIDPDFTIQYNNKTEYFEFKLSVYGSFIGKKKSKWIIGIDGTKLLTTQPNKLSEFLQGQAYQ